mmetsp:Transcript_2961/g.6861  ORF Transcript_2961/g.6861 Transcript_2961/m.6861 type:complete len:89 (-) Transcript_2961:676-942(-)|eukprot:CAMPEP_0171488766 /NCGR_PEP_ID=MMETSP0958-20121227/2384_1 /TAXON_ID=87120 /ORGANISM="Aurantiochytrium limacinum, Strain ATCCMYA-1381" /LENGTH=88 /DNA_ID=CAMNT_0012021905 /DNA_START=199 /DNA_END=465 /DNA_ORIENTATION=+
MEEERLPVRNPQYPVIDRDPSFGKVFAYMKVEDIGLWAGCTAASAVAGYAAGKFNRGPMVFGMGVIGFTGGVMLAMQNSYGRLIGERR